MRKIIATTFVSLDGVMQAPGAPDEDTTGGFDLGGWMVPYMDDAVAKVVNDTYSPPYDLLLGRRTYDIFAAYWPNVEKDPSKPGYDAGSAKMGKDFDAATKYVATHSPETLSWQHSRWLGQNIVQSLTDLKKQDGAQLLVAGSSKLVQTLIEHRLVDEIQLLVFPIVLGKGKRLFADDSRSSGFKVTHSKMTPGGVMTATYALDGDVKTGSFVDSTKTKNRSERENRTHV